MSMTSPSTTTTREQFAPLLHRSSVAPHSTLPQTDHLVFLRDDLQPRPDYFANPSFQGLSPNLPGEMQTTISLKQVSCGTELSIVQEGISEASSPEACYLGWQESLTLLANLVEAEIPG
jgi:hypothetical protein